MSRESKFDGVFNQHKPIKTAALFRAVTRGDGNKGDDVTFKCANYQKYSL